jgi:predicted AAA+ superfamily ATPase
MEEAFILQGISRFDIKGKRILEGEKKYYLNDLGFKRYLFSDYDLGQGKILENYVFNFLKQRNYDIHIGRIADSEIDFIATNVNSKIYIQVAYLLSDDVVEREYGNLQKIDDNWEKLVISLDDVQMKHKAGIKHLRAWELDGVL